MARALGRRLFGPLLLLWLVACGTDPGSQEVKGAAPEAEQNPLYVDPASHDFAANPKLLERILATPHGYFRFVNVPFSREVCRRFRADFEGTPAFNLHGDAHVEQYAVTDLGRGLTDFDDSSTGPAIIDLARYGVSTFLAGEQQGFGDSFDLIYDQFLRGYRVALEDPSAVGSEPRLASAKREQFKHDRASYFDFVGSVMEPMADDERGELEAALGPYFEAMREDHPELGSRFFDVEGAGYLRMGIGSALDLKFLVRSRGRSDDPLDDVVLEVKQVRDLTSIDCIRVSPGSDPFRVLVAHARIAAEPYKYLGYARFREDTFWVHAWVENYSELDIEDLESAEELAEVAYDVGLQLGRGHTRQIAGPLDRQLRREQLRLIDRDAEKIKASCRKLAEMTLAAWERFRAAA